MLIWRLQRVYKDSIDKDAGRCDLCPTQTTLMNAKKPYIFLSHSRHDKDFTLWLGTQLHEAGFNTWMDINNIPDGSTWAREIEQGVRECGALVVILSKEARRSDWVENETLLAIDLRKPVFVALIEDVSMPIYLVNRQYTDFRQKREKAARQLVTALRKAPLTEPLPAPVKPREAAKLAPEPNETNFFKYMEQLPDGEQAARIARTLYKWAQDSGAALTFSGFSTPVMHAKIVIDSGAVTVFSIWAYSRQPAVQIPLQYLQVAPPYDEPHLRLSTLDALNRLLPADAHFPDEKANLRPNLPLVATLGRAEALADFQQIIHEIIHNLREQ